MYEPLSTQVDLPAIERAVLKRWAETDVFGRSLAQRAGGEPWVCYEGPPTANGMPGAHHVEARVFKDLFPRYATMKGHHVPRRAGWDCHGLPVELAVEQELGFSGKQDIEAYGIAEFNAKCRESVERHVDAFEAMTTRMGYWVDMSTAYRTMDPSYIESVWWSLQQIFRSGRLVEDHRVAPYCPRCGTALSDHEVAQGYLTVTDPSVYVRFPVTAGPLAEAGATLLVWTTTPWTLIANTAVAVNPDVTYVTVRIGGEVLVVAEPLLGAVFGDAPVEVLERFPGKALEHTEYSRPFDWVDFDGAKAHFVAVADYVTTEDGTGLVHQAPAFGADDLAVARRYGLPVISPVRADGTFEPSVPEVGGVFFKDADDTLVTDLQRRGLLFRHVAYEHSYPHCWRCDTPLLYYALPSWYIRTTAVKDRLLAENADTDWHPDGVREGRYGDWLRNNVDWALSRNRYWGTPLPLWKCSDGHVTCIGSRAELGQLAGRDVSDVDPHRPFIDRVTFDCPEPGCTQVALRVPEVIDAWYDSGSMPFAQWGYPHHNTAEFEAAYPARFICEAIDQTRGWFYTLMAIGTLVFDRSSYQTVLCLGHILAEDGRKMSKHLGNVLEPMSLMDTHGADALRWFMAAGGSPWSARRIGHHTLEEIVRKVLLTYWNTASFLSLYARAAQWTPAAGDAPAPADRPAIDRWALSELHATVSEVDSALAAFDAHRAGRRISTFVDDLSNWYVRRSRRRFWNGEPAALATLHECVQVLTRLMAPITPFLTDRVWEAMIVPTEPDAPDSVHLASWPVADESLVDVELGVQMAVVRRLVELGRAARTESGMKTRQPLARALVGAAGWAALPGALRDEVAAELNVADMSGLAGGSDLLEVFVKPNFRALGRRFGPHTQLVAEAIGAAGAAELVAALRGEGSVRLTVDLPDDAGGRDEDCAVRIGLDDVVISEQPRSGWAVAQDGGETIALDLELTPALRRSGLARDAIRLIQDGRKAAGLQVTDRIELWWSAQGELRDAMTEHHALIADEVLAVSYQEGRPLADVTPRSDEDLGLAFWLRAAGE